VGSLTFHNLIGLNGLLRGLLYFFLSSSSSSFYLCLLLGTGGFLNIVKPSVGGPNAKYNCSGQKQVILGCTEWNSCFKYHSKRRWPSALSCSAQELHVICQSQLPTYLLSLICLSFCSSSLIIFLFLSFFLQLVFPLFSNLFLRYCIIFAIFYSV
jgi:hypothetical protein